MRVTRWKDALFGSGAAEAGEWQRKGVPGVDDAMFVRAVYEALKPGGYSLIYNLYPAQPADRYLPWADGGSPFERVLLETAGFMVLGFDVDDTAAARAMGAALGWAEQMNLETDLFGIYTLARK